MKKITLFFLFLTISFGYSQTVLEDFEGSPDFSGFSGLEAGTSVTTDPVDAMNTAGRLEVTAGAGDPWQGANLIMQSNYIDVSDPVTKPVSIDVYATESFSMFAKLDGGQNGAVPSAADVVHTGNGWETLTFTFNESIDSTAPANGEYSVLALFPNWNGAGWHDPALARVIYVDNITAFAGAAIDTCSNGMMDGDETGVDCGGSCDPCATGPTEAAPDPPARDPAEVVSIYSDAYASNITYTNFDAGWCGGAAVTGVTVSGNNTLQKNSGIDCHGIDFAGDRQDLSAFTHLHFDFYITDADLTGDVFNVKLVDFAGGSMEASALEVNINGGTTPQLVANQWVSVDVDITALGGVVAGSTTRSDIAQIGITTANVTNVWYDNIYLHQNTTLSTDEFTISEFKAFPNPTTDNWELSSNQEITKVQLYDILGKKVLELVPSSDNTIINASSLISGIYFARIESVNGSKTMKLIKK